MKTHSTWMHWKKQERREGRKFVHLRNSPKTKRAWGTFKGGIYTASILRGTYSLRSTRTMLALVFLFVAAAEAGGLQTNRYYQLVAIDKSIHKQPEQIPQYRPEKPKHYQQDESEIKFSPYSFGYVATGEDGMSSRKETSDDTGTVRGSYSLQDADGRTRTVEYVADADGFKAKVKTNEPGTKSDDPANVEFKSSAPEPQLDQPIQQQPYKSASPQSYKPVSPPQSYKPAPPSQFYQPSSPQHKAPAVSYQPQGAGPRDEPKKSDQQHSKKFLLVPYDGPWS